MVAMLVLSACSPSHKDEVDRLNSKSYAFHYRSLDSTKVLADSALSLSEDYSAGYAEACNNLAFVAIAKMNYKLAKQWLNRVESKSDNQIELLIADVQNMRLCQREARNKEFYSYREKAMRRLRRIGEEADNLPPRERKRAIYAKSEFAIVAATYFYYVQLEKPMVEALNELNPDELEQDTAQYLNYLYNFGSGGAITHGTSRQIAQTEFDLLMQCYMLASGPNPYPYWQANVLQAISEHIQDAESRDFLVKNNLPAFQYLNVEQMPTYLLAGNFAQRALNLFSAYGDVYQTAGAYRTVAECYWTIQDYYSAANCLNHALYDNKAIFQAPDLVASIREQLSLVYSAVDDKPKSDYNRNAYLDLQEMSRQDRQLEARAAQLEDNAVLLNTMIGAVILVIVLLVALLYVFDLMKRKRAKHHSMDGLLEPLRQWSEVNELSINEIKEKREEILEQQEIVRRNVEDNRKRNLEQRAKVSLVNSITPFIDRMIHEVDRLAQNTDSEEVKQERYEYISELCDKINQYNSILTDWITMRQGALNLRIESFPLQPLFDIVSKARSGFMHSGIELKVEPTDVVVKADRTLTLFMINTIADNARKFTPAGGKVTVSAREENSMVEISVRDTGRGMDEETLAHVFDRTYTGGHGFGLLNCKGIIDKYKKVSSLFASSIISVESEVGKGSKFVFSLPRGIRRMALTLVLLLGGIMGTFATSKSVQPELLRQADAYADSAYFCNINAQYARTLQMVDSAIVCFNRYYLSSHPDGKYLMVLHPQVGTAAEIKWLNDSVAVDYNVILDLRNECAVAALALHKWNLYESNNKVYTHLFRDLSSDRTLGDYVRTMQVSENAKTVAIVILIVLLLQLPLAYYLLYYRHVLSFRFAVDKVGAINKVLLSNQQDAWKLDRIKKIWNTQSSQNTANAELDELVRHIEEALRNGMDVQRDEASHLDSALDELHCAEYENDKLHIANAVLDNCLSALKHETMYYPSRIRQLIDTSPADVQSLREIVDYYKSLYSVMSSQAIEQVEGMVKCDAFLMHYLTQLMSGNEKHTQVIALSMGEASKYVRYRVVQQEVAFDNDLHSLLFTPLTSNLKYLVARQIVREIGEVMNMRSCGIQAMKSEDGKLVIEAILPAKLVKV